MLVKILVCGKSDSSAQIMADETKIVVENGDGAPPKSAKQLAKEAAKQAKLDKLKQKLEKQQNAAPKKDKEEVRIFSHMYLNLTYYFWMFRRKRRKRKPKRLLSMILIHQKVRKRMLRALYQMLTALSMLKPLGIVGGRNKDFSNLNMGYVTDN